MMRHRVRSALRTRRGRVVATVAALVVVLALVGSGYALTRQPVAQTVTRHETTSLEIIAWSHVSGVTAAPGKGPVYPPDVKLFDETITDHGLVHDVQQQLDSLMLGMPGGCGLFFTTYLYEFRFATNGVTTETYTGSATCPQWGGTRHGVSERQLDDFVDIRGITLDGVEILNALHERIGMPLPSGWNLGSMLASTPGTGSCEKSVAQAHQARC